jgi:hypothetical protein
MAGRKGEGEGGMGRQGGERGGKETEKKENDKTQPADNTERRENTRLSFTKMN